MDGKYRRGRVKNCREYKKYEKEKRR